MISREELDRAKNAALGCVFAYMECLRIVTDWTDEAWANEVDDVAAVLEAAAQWFHIAWIPEVSEAFLLNTTFRFEHCLTACDYAYYTCRRAKLTLELLKVGQLALADAQQQFAEILNPLDPSATAGKPSLRALVDLKTTITEEWRMTVQACLPGKTTPSNLVASQSDQILGHWSSDQSQSDGTTVEERPDGPKPPNMFCWNGRCLQVTPLTYRLLTYMWKRQNKAVEEAFVIDALWGENNDKTPKSLKDPISLANRCLEELQARVTIGQKNGFVVME